MRSVTGVVLGMSALLSGCSATWDVPHTQLAKLDGYRAPQTVVLKGTSDEDVTFGPKSHLIAEEQDVQLVSASVVNGTLVGVTPSGSTVRIKLTSDGTAIVGERSRFLIVTGAVLVGLAGAGLFMLVVDPPCNDRCVTR
jgi:hypothetical protein